MASTQTSSETDGGLDVKELLKALVAFKQGDFSFRLPREWTGRSGKIADALNDVIAREEKIARELERISNTVGKQGKITQRVRVGEANGSWQGMVDSVNSLINDLARPTSEIARVIGAVAKGDLAQTMEMEVEGRPLEGEFVKTARIVNTMVSQLGSFASEVTRVAREVGTEGKLGGQAFVKGVGVTSFAMSGDKDRVMQAGADEYISKPINTRELPGLIERLFGERGPP